jgi:hypothetical protein
MPGGKGPSPKITRHMSLKTVALAIRCSRFIVPSSPMLSQVLRLDERHAKLARLYDDMHDCSWRGRRRCGSRRSADLRGHRRHVNARSTGYHLGCVEPASGSTHRIPQEGPWIRRPCVAREASMMGCRSAWPLFGTLSPDVRCRPHNSARRVSQVRRADAYCIPARVHAEEEFICCTWQRSSRTVSSRYRSIPPHPGGTNQPRDTCPSHLASGGQSRRVCRRRSFRWHPARPISETQR